MTIVDPIERWLPGCIAQLEAVRAQVDGMAKVAYTLPNGATADVREQWLKDLDDTIAFLKSGRVTGAASVAAQKLDTHFKLREAVPILHDLSLADPQGEAESVVAQCRMILGRP